MGTRKSENLTLANALDEAFDRFSDSTAIRFGSERFSYGDLNRASGAAAKALLNLGLKCGDRVAIRLPKGMAMVILYLACLRSGIIALPLNPVYPVEELRYFLSDSGASFLFADEGSRSVIDPVRKSFTGVEDVVYGDPSGYPWLLHTRLLSS